MGTGKSVDLNVYWQLRNLGFEESIALKAASKFPEDICKAQNYILNNSTRSNKMPKFIDKCESTEKCESIKRMISILKYQCTNNIDINASELLSKSFLILNDYHHILDHHLNEDNISKTKSDEQFTYILNEINFKCELITCNRYIRNNRQRETRKLDYDCNLSMYVDLLDTIHCLFLHSTDTGYRIIPQSLNTIIKMWPHINDDHDNKLNNNHNLSYDKETVQLKAYLSQKRKLLQAVKGTYRLYNNKFMTPIMSQCNADLIDTDEKKFENCDINASTFGEFWGGSNGSLIMIKYESMKEELLNNKIFSVEKTAFDSAYAKGIFLLKESLKIKRIKSIKGNEIEIYNILSVICYTDFDTLCFNFGQTFRRNSENNSSESVADSQREFWHWSQKLIQTINCYGTIINESNITKLYHGINLLYFDNFITEFIAPVSTSTRLEIALMLTNDDGLILELGKYEKSNNIKYFNCSFVSCYANEYERLFISPIDKNMKHYLRLNGIRNLNTNENYKHFIHAMVMFEEIINGKLVKLLELDAEIINGLITYVLEGNNIYKYPKYVLICFDKWKKVNMDGKWCVTINLKGLMEYNILSEYEQHKNLLSFDKINILFKQVETIKCKEVGMISSSYIKCLEKVLKRVNKLKFSKLNEIWLSDVKNVKVVKRKKHLCGNWDLCANHKEVNHIIFSKRE